MNNVWNEIKEVLDDLTEKKDGWKDFIAFTIWALIIIFALTLLDYIFTLFWGWVFS